MLRRTKPLRKSRLSPVSAKRKREMVEYAKKRKAFLAARPVCEVWLAENGWVQHEWWDGPTPNYVRVGDSGNEARVARPEILIAAGAPRPTDIHHVRGRGQFYLDETTWMAVSRANHERIHHNASWARERGYLK